jgi:SAM-dependent methyltransferase
MLRNFLQAPEVSQVDVDSSTRLNSHKVVLQRKPMLQEVFRELHWLFLDLDRRYFRSTGGMRVELGAGVAPVRDTDPGVLATDIVESPDLDRVLDAQAMDLPDTSVHAFYGQNCFHHFPEPASFFNEVLRVVKPGGGIILIEPYHGLFASFLFKRLFRTEGFDKSMPGWNVPMDGPMNGANQALSYVVFDRDRALFAERYPQLEIVHQAPLTNYVRYLVSGGLNFRQLAPNFLIPVLKLVEALLSPLRCHLALHHVIVVRRNDA